MASLLYDHDWMLIRTLLASVCRIQRRQKCLIIYWLWLGNILAIWWHPCLYVFAYIEMEKDGLGCKYCNSMDFYNPIMDLVDSNVNRSNTSKMGLVARIWNDVTIWLCVFYSANFCCNNFNLKTQF